VTTPTNAHLIHIDAGQALRVTGAGGVVAGTLTDNGNANFVYGMVGGPGELQVSNTAAPILVNQGRAANGNGTQRATLDLTQLGSFGATVSRVAVGTTTLGGAANAQNATGTLLLARTNLIITSFIGTGITVSNTSTPTNAIEIGSDNGNAGGVNYFVLGQTNAVFTDSVGVGTLKTTASMLFNPAFPNPVAYFRGTGGAASRVRFWTVGDMSSSGSSTAVANGTNDFSGGRVDLLIDTLSLGRDRQGGNAGTGTTRGTVTFTDGIVDVNTAFVGNQAFGNAANSNPMAGVLNVNGAGALLVVNSSLVLGRTTVGSVAAVRTSGILNIQDGEVRANSIGVGAASTNNLISINNGTLTVSNTVASPARGLTSLTLTNSLLRIQVAGVPNMVVTNLVTGGATNIIDPMTVAVFPSYPTQVTVLRFTSLAGEGLNFGLGDNALPSSAPGAYLSNNLANNSVDLVLPLDPRPKVTTPPANYAGSPGDSVSFTPVYTGAAPFTFAWQKNGTNLSDGGNISGTATDTLAIVNAQDADSGYYTVVIANAFGSITSAPPTVLAISANDIAPTISGPDDQVVVQGQNATFTGLVVGKPIPSLQWQRDGVDLPGETNFSLTIINAQYPADDGAVFSLIASNSVAAVTNSATLTVTVPPVITASPSSLTVTNSAAAAFSVTATGVPAPAYQWFKNAAPIPDATNNTYSIGSTVPSDAGVYSVTVANTAGSASSTNVTLLVNSTMAAATLSPANGSVGVCYDTPLYLTFSAPPILGTAGRIRIFNATNAITPVETIDLSLSSGAGTQVRTIGGSSYNTHPIVISGNTASIFPRGGVLTSNQTYYVLIDNVLNGPFKDTAGATFAGIAATNTWRFTTRPTGPTNPTNIVIAADGTGDFCTVQGAVDFVPSGNTTPRVLNIRNGIYHEIVYVNNRHALTFVGQSRDQVWIRYPNNDALNPGTSLRPSFRLAGSDNALVNLTVTNSTPKGGTQAEALRTDGRRIVLLNVKLASYQDTMLNNNNGDLVYVQDSLIQGDTDFIWGSSTLFVTNSEIRTLSSGTQITQARTAAGTNGFSFVGCRLTRFDGAVVNCGLGRAIGFLDGNVAWINCRIDSHITGWQEAVARSWEYGNSNLAGTVAVTYNGTQLTSTDPNLTNAMSAPLWLYGWQPQTSPVILTNPVSQSVGAGDALALSVAAIGIPQPTYQWQRNGTNLIGETNATLTIASAFGGDAGSYRVTVANSAGSVLSAIATVVVANTAPQFAPVPDQVVNVGVSLNLTNVVTDPDVPPQALTFELLAGPTNATVDVSGVFSWRPNVFQADTTNSISIRVSDNGSPSLSATNAFSVAVNPLAPPGIDTVLFGAGQISFSVNGQAGPDYAVQTSPDLAAGIWTTVLITNSPAMPFSFVDTNGTAPALFYRVLVGPPLP
jgi:pectin methylesterase-like acyl-CoA thioesterase